MRTIAKLFGQSPFVPLRAHMDKVALCVEKVPVMFEALVRGDHAEVENLANEISTLEHEADQVKHDIQDHMPRSLFLPVDRDRLLEILSTQDNLADKCENIGVLLTLKQLTMPTWLAADFDAYLKKNLAAFAGAHAIIKEMDSLLETGFGGPEAEKVLAMVQQVAYTEHEVDVLQRQLLRHLLQNESDLTVGDFFLWQRLFMQVSDLSDMSERLANRVRRTLELKR
jgi:predicted phosphate transport protein (TIGR00153 family)